MSYLRFTGMSLLLSSSKGECRLTERVTFLPLSAKVRILSASPDVESEMLRSDTFSPSGADTSSRKRMTLP